MKNGIFKKKKKRGCVVVSSERQIIEVKERMFDCLVGEKERENERLFRQRD